VSSCDGQGNDSGERRGGGDPQRAVSAVDLPEEAGAAGHCLADMNAGGRPRGEGADDRDLVGRRLRDLFAGLFDLDERLAQVRHGRQLGELAQHKLEGVEAVADGDGEQVGAVGVVEHVGVGLDHGIAGE
jgi:hypothetical protein